MTRSLSLVALTALTPGEMLPELRGEYLNGEKAVLPKDAAGRAALLLFGFTYRSRFAVEAWAEHFRADFGKHPDVTFYEIPMIGGMARLGKWFIDRGMRQGTPEADYRHVITVYSGTNAWRRYLNVEKEDDACLVLMDRKGYVAWRDSGPFDELKYQILVEQVRKLADEK